MKDGLSKTKAESLLITFALLVEAFANSTTGHIYRHSTNNRPNVKAIAEHLEKLAQKTGRDSLPGQGNESISGRIEKALELKMQMTPKQ